MSKKFLRSITSLILSGVMIMQIMPGSASAENFSQGRVVVDAFNAFTTYTKSKDSGNNPILPDGFKIATDGTSSTNFAVYKDQDSGNIAFSLTGWQDKAVYAFPEAIVTGKVHLTFDVLTSGATDTSKSPSLWVSSHNLDIGTTQNIEDYYYHLDGNGKEKDSQKNVIGEQVITFFGLKKDDLIHYNLGNGYGTGTSAVTEGSIVVSNGATKGDGLVGDGRWHKIDLLIDLDNNLASLTYDGIEIYENVSVPGTGGIKDIFLLSGNGGTIAIDNWYINHYFDELDNKSLMHGECIEEDESIVLSFSEQLSRDLDADDFYVTNAAGENIIPISVETYTNSSVKLKFESLQTGIYTVTCRENIFTNERMPSNSVFVPVNSIVNFESDKNFFINEDFEGYGGGMPVDWYGLTAEIPASSLVASEHGDGKALKIDSGNPIAYSFKSSLMTGIYNIEFDVKNGSGWYMHLLDTAMTDNQWCKNNSTDWLYQQDFNRLYEEYKVSQGTNYSNEGWNAYIKDTAQDVLRKEVLEEAKKKTVVLGQEGNLIKWNKGRESDLSNGVTLSARGTDEWTKVSMTIDFNKGGYSYKIGNAAPEEVIFASPNEITDGTLRYDRIALINHNTLTREFVHGVGGIGFTAVGNMPLEIDNIKVYSNNSYNFYEDFNTVQTNGVIRTTVQPGWYNLLYEGYGKYGYNDVASGSKRNIGIKNIDRVDANSTESLDGTAAQLINTTAPIVGLFDTPIGLGKNFVIELDWRNTGSNILYLGIVDRANMYSKAKNTKNPSTGHPATGEVSSGQGDVYPYTAILRACEYGFSYWEPHNYKSIYANESDISGKKLLNPVSEGVWHLKYNIKTSSTKFSYQLTVTSKDGNTVYISDWVDQNKMFTYTMNDIVGITLGGRNSYVDNIKVYEAVPFQQPFVSSYTVTYPDGVMPLENTIASSAQSVSIELTEPIYNTDGISVEYSDGEDVLCDLKLKGDKTVIISFPDALKVGKTVTFGVSQFTDIKDAKYSGGINTTSKSLYVIEGSGKLVINEFRLYEKLGGTQLYFNYPTRPDDLRTIPEGWYPVLAESLSKKLKDNLKLVVNGYNYGKETELMVILAGYDTNAAVLKQRVVETIIADKGSFEATIDLSTLTDEDITRIKAFVWDKNTYAPRTGELDY